MVKGVVRHIDDLGRVVIPKEIRKSLGINDGDPIDIFHSDGVVHLKRVAVSCVCCGVEETENVKLWGNAGVLLCRSCLLDFVLQEEPKTQAPPQ